MRSLGITGEEIDIKPAALQMLKDIGHPYARGEPVFDVTFENVQAGLRTDYLFRLANQRKAFVLGTGTCPKPPGWCHHGDPLTKPLQRQWLGAEDADPAPGAGSSRPGSSTPRRRRR